jgi:hypothetical protein
MTGDSQEFSGRDGPVGEPIPPLRGRSLPLPGLKHWRLRKRLRARMNSPEGLAWLATTSTRSRRASALQP